MQSLQDLNHAGHWHHHIGSCNELSILHLLFARVYLRTLAQVCEHLRHILHFVWGHQALRQHALARISSRRSKCSARRRCLASNNFCRRRCWRRTCLCRWCCRRCRASTTCRRLGCHRRRWRCSLWKRRRCWRCMLKRCWRWNPFRPQLQLSRAGLGHPMAHQTLPQCVHVAALAQERPGTQIQQLLPLPMHIRQVQTTMAVYIYIYVYFSKIYICMEIYNLAQNINEPWACPMSSA